MRQRYFEPKEKLGLVEEVVYDHRYNEDENLIEREGYSFEFIYLASLLAMVLLAMICF